MRVSASRPTSRSNGSASNASSPRRCSWRSPISSCRSWPTCPGVFREIGAADWSWVPLVVLFSALTYVGAALGMGGAVPARLRAVPTLLTQVAASFASNLAPAGVGGMALNVRYLQKSGVDAPVAASSVGLNSVAGFAVHIVLMFVFFVWAGTIRARLDLAAELVGRRHRRRGGRGAASRPRSRSRSRARCSSRSSCPVLRQRVERPRGGDPQPRQDRAAARRLRRAHAELRVGRLLLDGRVRRWPRPRPGRRRVPRRFGHRHGRAHARRARRARGGGDRRSRRRRHAEHRPRSRPCSCSGSPPTGCRSSRAGSRSTTSAAPTSSSSDAGLRSSGRPF